jgi:hypothetical protein
MNRETDNTICSPPFRSAGQAGVNLRAERDTCRPAPATQFRASRPGQPAETLVYQNINGPWDMAMRASSGHAALFVSNALSRPAGAGTAPPPTGLCTVVRASITLTAGAKPHALWNFYYKASP